MKKSIATASRSIAAACCRSVNNGTAFAFPRAASFSSSSSSSAAAGAAAAAEAATAKTLTTSAAGRMMMLRCSAPRRLFSPNPLQSFHHDSKILELPEPGKAPRPFQGLDMKKVQDNPWINVWTTRRQMETGYQWGNYSGPSIHAPTPEEVASFFDCSDWKQKYTWQEMAKAAYPQLRILLMFVGCVALPALPIVVYAFQQQRYEAMEVTIPEDEFFKHYRWHYYGPELDHHGFTAYLEARRAKRWRHLDVDPERWIPPQYFNDDGGPERKRIGNASPNGGGGH